jgi:hypothetical protein
MAGTAIANRPTELTIKPNSGDYMGWDNVSASESQKMKYSTLKGFFLKTDENNTGLTGNIQVNDNVKFIAGNSSDFKLYHDGTDTLLLNDLLNSETILRFKTGPSSTIDMLRLNPAGPTISISTTNLAHTDNPAHGLNFNSSGHTVIKILLDCRGDIDLNSNYISGTQTPNTGLTFNGGENATFTGNVTLNSGTLNVNSGNVNVSSGNVLVTGYVDTTNYVRAQTYLKANQYCQTGTYVRAGTSLDLKDAISVPATEGGWARIFVHSTDGDLKVKFGDGFVARLAFDA